jgi:hypothetical protein
LPQGRAIPLQQHQTIGPALTGQSVGQGPGFPPGQGEAVAC